MSADPPETSSAPGGSEPDPRALSGPDLVRAALASAKAMARSQGLRPGRARPRPLRAARSGSGPDARDPVPFGTAVRRLVAERGWEDTHANASVLGRWEELAGPELAAHCRPVSLVDGELVLVAESSAWATQVRLMARDLVRSLTERVGPDVVRSVVVRGPAQPDWRKGPRRVQGRGPRDTYG